MIEYKKYIYKGIQAKGVNNFIVYLAYTSISTIIFANLKGGENVS